MRQLAVCDVLLTLLLFVGPRARLEAALSSPLALRFVDMVVISCSFE